jgi:hypothetical protein
MCSCIFKTGDGEDGIAMVLRIHWVNLKVMSWFYLKISMLMIYWKLPLLQTHEKNVDVNLKMDERAKSFIIPLRRILSRNVWSRP